MTESLSRVPPDEPGNMFAPGLRTGSPATIWSAAAGG
jgi:hypothetical protein